MRSLLLLAFALASACSAPHVVSALDEAPPPELGRPGWVRASAKAGAIVGAGAGAICSIVLLPITLPISWLADEPLGKSREEFLFMPVSAGASAGHFLLGAPADGLHFAFYRAWTEPPPAMGYDYTPTKPPVGPGAAVPPAAATKAPPSGQ